MPLMAKSIDIDPDDIDVSDTQHSYGKSSKEEHLCYAYE